MLNRIEIKLGDLEFHGIKLKTTMSCPDEFCVALLYEGSLLSEELYALILKKVLTDKIHVAISYYIVMKYLSMLSIVTATVFVIFSAWWWSLGFLITSVLSRIVSSISVKKAATLLVSIAVLKEFINDLFAKAAEIKKQHEQPI